jgi:hypothetical protein
MLTRLESYAHISTDPDNKEQELTGLRPTFSALHTDFKPLYAYEVEAMLRNVTTTSPGVIAYLIGIINGAT